MTTPPPANSPDWARVKDVFHRALELQTGAREDFVRRECAGAEEVSAEVLSLLRAHERAADFLTTPAVTPGQLPAARRVGQQVGQYRIDRLLGAGGMGVVYLAQDLRLGRLVALKAIAETVAGDAVGRDRLRREARAAAALTHPGIATVYALEEIDGDLFIASEFVPGETLRDEIARGPLPAARVLDAAIALTEALSAAHDRGIVHRDLKPENVMRSTAGSLKVLDFGLARVRDIPPELAHLTAEPRAFGTPGYMSPEQVRGEPLDGRSDLFSLGSVLHELLTGVHPFAANDAVGTIARILDADPAVVTAPRAGERDVALHAGLIQIIRVLTRKDPAARYESAASLLKALETLRAGRTVEIPATGAKWAPADWWRFHQIAASAGYALLLVPIALGANTFDSPRVAMFSFLPALSVGVAAIAMRLHLWFVAASMPSSWRAQYTQSRRWLMLCDISFVVSMFAIGLAIRSDHNVLATLLVTGGVLALVSATLIEPATTRAAFEPAPSSRAD